MVERMEQDSSLPPRYNDTIARNDGCTEPGGTVPLSGSAMVPRAAVRLSHVTLRTMQYANLPTPIYCWSFDGRDLQLVDFNDAANDLTYGYIGDLLGAPARVIFRQHPEVIADLDRCMREQALIVRRGALYHPGLGAARPGVARYCFAPPDLVIVQVDVEVPREYDA